MTEESIVSKVEELMEALDNIKKYNAFARSLRRFAIILGSSIAAYLVLRTLFLFFNLTFTTIGVFSIALLLIPLSGFLAGILFVRRKVNSVKTGEWKEELSQGFPSALKMLLELDWETTFDEISVGKLGYALYGIIKTAGYWFVIFFVLERLWNLASLLLARPIPLFGDLLLILASLIVFLIVGDDLLRRYKEIHALDMLLWELRGLSLEFRRSEFKT